LLSENNKLFIGNILPEVGVIFALNTIKGWGAVVTNFKKH